MRQRGAFVPKKSLGQNFLVNPNVARRIVEACDLKPTDVILEIGAGKGALTHLIAGKVRSVIAVEKDDHLAGQLQKDFHGTNVTIVHADILEYPFEKIPDRVKIIGNLPYNIATPIIEKVFHYKKRVTGFYITVQLEYGQRIAARPHNKDYGSFSCFVQYHANPKILFKIKNASFQPVPKVQSCFLSMGLREKPSVFAKDEEFLFGVIRAAFGHRRKTIENSLSAILAKEKISALLQELKINPKLRAENLSLEDFARISNHMV